jgi:hypothetical protein
MTLQWFRRQTLAARVARPHPFAWAFLSLVLLAVAAALLLLDVVPFMPSALDQEFDANVLAAAVGVVAIFAIRRFLYARLARRPGPIEISQFSGEPPRGAGIKQVDMLAEFRRTLAEMTLSAPEPVPSEPSARGVVDDVSTAFDSDRGPFAAALLLIVSLLRVRHAYRVSVQILSSADGRCGLSVHVARLPSGRGEVESVWEDNWTTAAQRAAHVVGAFLVPRSRLSRRAPWLAWDGVQMPTELFHQSQRAARFVRERRYERAMDALHKALKEDPQNPYLRVELGQVQEQAGLHLDAAATYADIIAVESWFDGRLWRRLRSVLMDGTTGAPPARLSGKRNGRDALLIARYRVVARLGSADQLEDQWNRRPQARNQRRHADRIAMKNRLVVWLNSYARLYEMEDPWVDRPAGFVQDRVSEYENSEARLIHLIHFVGRHEAEALADDYRWSRGRRRPGLAISQTAVQLLKISAILHERQTRWQLHGPVDDWWPITPNRLDLRVGRRLYLKPGFARGWQEYYNAACITAIALQGTDRTEGGAEPARTLLAFQAVRHLERAVRSTDSGYVGRYAQWLSTGDHDLDALRSTPQFVDFLDRYLPNAEPRVPRPRSGLLKLLMSFHTARILMQYCDRRAEFWSRHLAGAGGLSPRVIESEIALERTATSLVFEYVSDDRHWQTRMKLIEEAENFCRRMCLKPIEDAFPAFQDDPVAVSTAVDMISETRGDADAYFYRVIEKRVQGMDDMLDVVGQRRRALENTLAEPAGSRTFWIYVARRLRHCLGIREDLHLPVSVFPRVSRPT